MTKKQAIILFISSIIAILLAIKPINYFCSKTGYCNPINFKYLMPKKLGEQKFDIIYETKDLSKNLDIKSDKYSEILTAGQDSQVKFIIKNNNQQQANSRPKRYIIPKQAAKYLEFYECLCSKLHEIDDNSSKTLTMRFNLKRSIENDEFFKNNPRAIRIGYEINDSNSQLTD